MTLDYGWALREPIRSVIGKVSSLRIMCDIMKSSMNCRKQPGAISFSGCMCTWVWRAARWPIILQTRQGIFYRIFTHSARIHLFGKEGRQVTNHFEPKYLTNSPGRGFQNILKA